MLKKYCYYLLFPPTGLLFPPVLSAQALPDTAKIYPLKGVEVKASVPSPFSADAPLQIMPSEVFSKTGALQVADAVKFFSGVQIRDYGGTGGLKMISIRGLNAGYSGTLYDGIPVFDFQTGQIDLGRFSLDNVSALVLQTGETGDLLHPAYGRAFAGTLNIITQNQRNSAERKTGLNANLKTGSFGLVNAALGAGRILNRIFSVRLSGEYLKSNGNYPFAQVYGFSDSTVRKRRKNSDVALYRLESNIYGNFPRGGELSGKAGYCRSGRGIPGPAVYYSDYSGERVKDETAFLQASYSQHLSRSADFRACAKFNFSAIDYTELAYREEAKENFYFQRQYFLNMTVRYRISEQLSASWANDVVYGNFESSFSGAFHTRMNYLSALTGKYEHPVFVLTGSLLYNIPKDKNKTGNAFGNRPHRSPYLGLSIKPVENIPIRLRAYYKNTYRFPTLGDLYLSPVPTPNLQPENADQYNVGLTFAAPPGGPIALFSLSADVYRINVENRLVALPRSSMFIWSVRNFGRTETRGIDLNLQMQWQFRSGFSAQLSAAGTVQQVLDKTDKTSPSYNRQLAYMPQHSATACLLLETPLLDINYTFVYCGTRNYMGLDRPEYRMKPYTEQGLHLQKTVRRKDCSLVFSAECFNLFDRQYEIVRSYPMPGRSFLLGMKFVY